MLEENEEIGRRVRRARLRLGMLQADLAAALGKTQGWVSKMERGLIDLDRVGLLNLFAAEPHVHPNDLIGRPYSSSPAEISGRCPPARSCAGCGGTTWRRSSTERPGLR